MKQAGKFISFILALLLAFTLLPQNAAHAEEKEQTIFAEGRLASRLEQLDRVEPKTNLYRAPNSTHVSGVDDSVIDYVRSCLKNRESSFEVQVPYQDSYQTLAREVLEAAMEHTGNPTEGDYLTFQHDGISFGVKGNTQELTLYYTAAYYTTAAEERTVDSYVRNLLNSLGVTYKNSYQKIKAVYNWLADNIHYSDNRRKHVYTAYGAIVDRDCVCQGYAVLFYRLMLELGIDVRVIDGDGGGPHAWNIVKVSGSWYDIDATWASTSGNHSAWFLRGSGYFPNHTENEKYASYDFRNAYPISYNNYSPSNYDNDTADVQRSVILNTPQFTMLEGDTEKISAYITPNWAAGELRYSTSDSRVAYADANGSLYAIAEGSAVIRVTSTGGGIGADVRVTVVRRSDDAGKAYALYLPQGGGKNTESSADLVFTRSVTAYSTDGWLQDLGITFKDIAGNRYTSGYLFTFDPEQTADYLAETPWRADPFRTHVTNVRVVSGTVIRPTFTIQWFKDCTGLETFNGRGFSWEKVLSTEQMFIGCTSLISADLGSTFASKCQYINNMFYNCTGLQSVNISPLVTDSLQSLQDSIFTGCKSLNEIRFASNARQYIPLLEKKWKKDSYVKTMAELREEYPSMYASYAGKWTLAHEHTWGKPSYTWSSDNKTVTAKAVCTQDGSHVLEETVTASRKVTKSPTCTAAGTAEMTASFKNSQFKTQKKTVTVKATGHSYGTPTYTWTSDYKKVTGKAVCKNDSSHVFKEESYTYFTVVKRSTATSDGTGRWKTAFISKVFTQQTKNVTIPKTGGSVNMYRLYNPNSGEHFYTKDTKEKNALVKVHGWTYEGIGWVAPKTSGTPVYRLYNKTGGEHHYTTDVKEKNALVNKYGWTDEGIGWYSDDNRTVPVFREYNPNAYANNHNYTPDTKEHNALVNKYGWIDEGTAWYALEGKK